MKEVSDDYSDRPNFHLVYRSKSHSSAKSIFVGMFLSVVGVSSSLHKFIGTAYAMVGSLSSI